jgi:hypothetical protein
MRIYKAPFEKELELSSDTLIVLEPVSLFLFAINSDYKVVYPDDLLDCVCLGWFNDFGVEYYIFDKKLVYLKIYEFNNFYLQVRIGARKGMCLYHGTMKFLNKYMDSNHDKVPDVVDFIIELCKQRKLLI